MIEKQGRSYILRSPTTGRVHLRGSRKAVVRREKQIRFFANVRKSRGGRGSLLAKVSPAMRKKEMKRRRELSI